MDSLYAFENKKIINEVLNEAFEDSYYLIRQYAVEHLIENKVKLKKYEEQVTALLTDESSHVRAVTVAYLGAENFEEYQNQLANALMDSSYMVVGSALNQFVENEILPSDEIMKMLEGESNLNVVIPMAMYQVKQKTENSFYWFEQKLSELKSQDLYYFIYFYSEKLLGAPKPYREKAARSFQDIAERGSPYTTRLSAYQALLLLTDIDGVEEMTESIKKNEKDPRLIDLYDQF